MIEMTAPRRRGPSWIDRFRALSFMVGSDQGSPIEAPDVSAAEWERLDRIEARGREALARGEKILRNF